MHVVFVFNPTVPLNVLVAVAVKEQQHQMHVAFVSNPTVPLNVLVAVAVKEQQRQQNHLVFVIYTATQQSSVEQISHV
jgi:hypothetical protein